MTTGMMGSCTPFPFPAAGPYPDPADPSGESISITLWVTPDASEVRASYHRDDDAWKLSSLSLLEDGDSQTVSLDELDRPDGPARRLREVLDRTGMAPPLELHLHP